MEVGHLGAGEHHRLPGVAKPLQIGRTHGRGDRNDPVHLRPSHWRGEIARLARLIAGRGRWKRLDDHETPARTGDLPGEASEELPEVVPAHAGSEDKYGHRVSHLPPFSVDEMPGVTSCSTNM